ncbi:hypothetical protein EHO61_10885 [Leptospira fluminis]|uniref:DUF3575 domain-containing protein n=1 Tax=Leptospira fluminis TaxID=2484979 RepID=A0A4R9GNP7_9LEPT|nr:hypothetical protein [Leptospira fluminis]TGK17958.1 hypothetical protein EHO61_10885 [Leptospira fluminis]
MPESSRSPIPIFGLFFFLFFSLLPSASSRAEEVGTPATSVPVTEESKAETEKNSHSSSGEKPKTPNQAELREKFKNQLGGFGYDRFFSFQYTRMLDSQWAIGIAGYTNTYVNRFDNDVAYLPFLSPNAFYGNLSGHNSNYKGGSFFVQRYLTDTPFFASLHLGRERHQLEESILNWETLTGTYRYEKDRTNWGPQNYAGFGLGLRYQGISGFFLGWEGIWNWYLPYRASYSVSDLYYSDHQANMGDLIYRNYALQNRYTHPGSMFALNLVVGWAF